MYILGIETSSIVASVAIYNDDTFLGEITINHPRTHSQKLMPIIENLFNRLNLKINDMDLIAVSNGPGSFTGIRIGLTTAKALAHKHAIDMVMISSLEGLAYNLLDYNGKVSVLIDGRRKRVYAQTFEINQNAVHLLEPAELTTIGQYLENSFDQPTIFIGSGVTENKNIILSEDNANIQFISSKLNFPSAASICEAAYRKSSGTYQKYDAVEANYIRKSQAEMSLEK